MLEPLVLGTGHGPVDWVQGYTVAYESWGEGLGMGVSDEASNGDRVCGDPSSTTVIPGGESLSRVLSLDLPDDGDPPRRGEHLMSLTVRLRILVYPSATGCGLASVLDRELDVPVAGGPPLGTGSQ
jgi:hypothetical protein